MSPSGLVFLLISAMSCCAAPAPAPCRNPQRLEVEELLGDWDMDSYPSGTMAVYRCRPGFELLGTIRMICLHGKWEFVGTRGQCRSKSCGHPGDIPFGSFKLIERDSFTFGSVVEYTCNAGYKMVSEERIRECTDNGWSGPVPRCEAVCPKPRNIKGAKLQGEWTEDAYSSGHVASFVPENSQDAPFRMACIEGTWWYISKSYYKEKLCGPPPIILYGDIVEDQKPNYTSGDSVIYKCPNYYVLKGNHVVSCLDGKWDEAPVCLEPCTVTKDHMEERNIDPKWKPDGRTIYISHGDSMEFVCKPGYKASPNPPMRVFCEQGKLEYPKCVKKA